MRIGEYIVEIQLSTGFNNVIQIAVKEENSELALNKVQGMLNVKDGWIHLEDNFGTKYRIKNEHVSYLRILPNQEVIR